jgi:hypothetical protein
MKLALSLFSFLILSGIIKSQTNPVIMDSLYFLDPIESRTIFFGVDPTATDTIDYHLGEEKLPPFPPAGVMEVRFILPQDNYSGSFGSERDFRNGDIPFSGQKEHRIKFQSHGNLKMIYNLASTIAIHVEDLFGGILINTDITGSDTLNIPDNLEQLKLLVTYTNATDVEDEKLNPNDFNLSQNYPNPFNPSTTIKYTLGEAQFVSLKVYDVLGNEVATLVKEEVIAGSYNVSFNANGLSSGIYFYSLTAGEITQTKSMMLLK